MWNMCRRVPRWGYLRGREVCNWRWRLHRVRYLRFCLPVRGNLTSGLILLIRLYKPKESRGFRKEAPLFFSAKSFTWAFSSLYVPFPLCVSRVRACAYTRRTVVWWHLLHQAWLSAGYRDVYPHQYPHQWSHQVSHQPFPTMFHGKGRKRTSLSQKFHGRSEKFRGRSKMFHGLPICPGVTSGATIGVTYHPKIASDFQLVKCQV